MRTGLIWLVSIVAAFNVLLFVVPVLHSIVKEHRYKVNAFSRQPEWWRGSRW